MATVSVTHALTLAQGRTMPEMLAGVVVGYIAISLGIGWLADTMHSDRAEVEGMAFTDILTHLPNRRHARLFLDNEFAAAERGRLLSVVLFDLDYFKRYNDEFGHAAGDAALKAFADILTESTRRMDLSARFGGEEFVSVLAGSDTEGALIFADRIRVVLSNTPLPTGTSLTVSAGVATYHPTMRSPDELLAAADSALYESKHQGRNRVRLFGHALLDHAMPSPSSGESLEAELGDREPTDYPRLAEEMGRTKPPLTLLPHQITGFGAGRKVLVVEDDDQVRKLVSNYLAREEFEVTMGIDVPTGMEALHQEFDVVVTDLRLPGQSGTDLIRAVKSRWPLTQVLVITGLQDPTVAAGALTAGADRYLFKPFGMPELRRHLVDSLKRRDRLAGQKPERPAPPGGQSDEVRAAVDVGVEHLARAMLARHSFLKGHAERASAFAIRIASEMDVPPDADLIRRAFLLCDIGNIGLPASLLAEEGPLDPDDVELMRTHPTMGRRMLQHLEADEQVLGAVSWHHERWDGAGYPDGLSRAAVPRLARLVALADALAAMTSPRPHRPAMEWSEAVAAINEGSGGQFDPALVEILNSTLTDLSDIFTAFGDEDGAGD
jgi:diguanylate cyclase (GGDEF)-like protein